MTGARLWSDTVSAAAPGLRSRKASSYAVFGRKSVSNSARGSANAAELHSVPAAATASAVRLTASVSLIITSPVTVPIGRHGGQNLPLYSRPRARPPGQRDHVVGPTL